MKIDRVCGCLRLQIGDAAQEIVGMAVRELCVACAVPGPSTVRITHEVRNDAAQTDSARLLVTQKRQFSHHTGRTEFDR